MEEKEYRKLIDGVYKKLSIAFEQVDPDIVEFETSQGSGILLFADGTKCILSTQPSTRQLWLAAASKGIAFHFNYNPTQDTWFDDKNLGIELFSFLKKLVLEQTKLELSF